MYAWEFDLLKFRGILLQKRNIEQRKVVGDNIGLAARMLRNYPDYRQGQSFRPDSLDGPEKL